MERYVISSEIDTNEDFRILMSSWTNAAIIFFTPDFAKYLYAEAIPHINIVTFNENSSFDIFSFCSNNSLNYKQKSVLYCAEKLKASIISTHSGLIRESLSRKIRTIKPDDFVKLYHKLGGSYATVKRTSALNGS